MANPNPCVRTRFQTGNRANPLGAGAHDPFLKQIKSLTKAQLLDVINFAVKSNMSEVQAIISDSHSPALKVMIATIIIRIVDKGDMNAFDLLLNRLIGKSRTIVETEEMSTMPSVTLQLFQPKKDLLENA